MIGIEFPDISPILFSIGPLSVRWYSLAYLFGIVAAWRLILFSTKKYPLNLSKTEVEDAVFYATVGIICGGRLGYVLFYGDGFFWQNPLQILAIWHGGMSFHGGATGAIIGLWYTARKYKTSFWQLADLAALYAPIGIFLGRLANFVNDELWGRVSDVAWAVRFPSGGYLPRHPSQLYEAATEGLLLLVLLNWLWWRYSAVRERKGLISALFVLGYAVSRIILEQFRQPDSQLGFFFSVVTMGQLLSLPLLLLGIWLLWRIFRPLK